MVMRRLLGSALPALLLAGALTATLAGCGGDESGTVADDPAPTTSSSPTRPSTGDEVDFELVEMITETAAGGAVEADGAAVPLTDDVAVQEFTAQFETDAMTTRLQNAVDKADVPDDMLLYGAIVSIGCDSPTDVSVTVGDQGLVISAQKVPSPMQECFAPMTTVALVLVPASAVS
jgi:hypothetical protein